MIQLIVGRKGKGKTKYLLDKVNAAIKDASGNIVYLDKSGKHMYELNNRVRLINVKDYGIETSDEFIGFVCGIISQDHDLEELYFDSFLKIAGLGEEHPDVEPVLDRLNAISISLDEKEMPEKYHPYVIVSL